MVELSANNVSFDRPQLIEASAGTGKTYTITNLCLRLLLGRNLPWDRPLAINEILILTFTIAATAELKSRIRDRISEAKKAYRDDTGDDFLRQLVEQSPDRQRDLKLLTAASQLMDEAAIFTIHGFCARVLGEQAFESGSLFDTQLNAERDHLLKAACEDCFRRFVLPLEPSVRSMALSIWRSPDIMAKAFSPFLFRGPLLVYPPATDSIGASRLDDKIRRIKQQWITEDLEGLLRQSDLHKGRKPYKRLEQMTAFCQENEGSPDSELWSIYGKSSLNAAMKSGASAPSHPALALIDEIPGDVLQLKANIWHGARHSIESSLDMAKLQGNLLTLDDLLTKLAEAVNRPGSTLAATLSERWPVAMIDEFQDTDAVQTSIFSPVYQTDNVEACLLMIGDPKQAIYGFRGADIYTYINTRRETSNALNLTTNWRSSPAMIEATNLLFNQPNLFGNDADIPFTPVSPPDSHADMAMTVNGRTVTPYEVFVDDQPDAIERLMAHAAERTAALLAGDDRAMVNGKPVRAGQIAFLVRRQKDALAAQQALNARGIKSVYLTLESVFLQSIATDLRLILEAIIEPTNELAVRSALATRLMQSTANEIDQLNDDISFQQARIAEFQHYHQLWLDKDIAHMLGKLMNERQLARKWLGQPDGERQLTNLRHLTELLQQQSAITPGMHQLVKWFAQEQLQAETVSAEERQLRLESDENLVKIVTMHAAKGLEYDIVMIPMSVFLSPREQNPYLFHEEIGGNYRAAVELFNDEEHVRLFREERRAEDMRLLYVSLTRAKFRCYLGLPAIRELGDSAIARLLSVSIPDDNDKLIENVRRILPPHLFDVVTADADSLTPIQSGTTAASGLTAPPEPPIIQDHWRVHSYTSIATKLHQPGHAPLAGYLDDDERTDSRTDFVQRSRHNFPKGARVGVALHSLMEDIDFQVSTHTALCERTLKRLGLDDSWLDVLEEWLNDILNAPLGGFALTDISTEDRLDEMEFHFTMQSEPDLVTTLIRSGTVPPGTSSIPLSGQMTGLIDLLFRRDGRYYVVDYKSNYLGRESDSYHQERLETAMTQHQYYLQYLIYTVAVHRMLKQRISHYRYEEHFGGVYYLFLRGMNQTDNHGVFYTRPSASQVEQLNELLGHTGGLR